MPNRRPRLALQGHTATPEEAAAVIAAVERFLRDHAPPLAAAPERLPGWIKAARREATDREPHYEPWL